MKFTIKKKKKPKARFSDWWHHGESSARVLLRDMSTSTTTHADCKLATVINTRCTDSLWLGNSTCRNWPCKNALKCKYKVASYTLSIRAKAGGGERMQLWGNKRGAMNEVRQGRVDRVLPVLTSKSKWPACVCTDQLPQGADHDGGCTWGNWVAGTQDWGDGLLSLYIPAQLLH